MIVTLALGLLAQMPAAEPDSPKPVPLDPQSWVSTEDFPFAAIRDRQEGTVGFRLDVDASGVVTQCTILTSSKSDLLDARTCQIMRARARFQPARDSRGRVVESRWSSRLSWRLPDRDKPPSLGFHVTTFEVRPDGTILSCRTVDEEGAVVAEGPCPVAGGAGPAWLLKYAPTYRVLRLQLGYAPSLRPPAAGADWGRLISTRLISTGYSAARAPVDCNLLASTGPPDMVSERNTCPAKEPHQVQAEVVDRIVDGWAIYGVPRSSE